MATGPPAFSGQDSEECRRWRADSGLECSGLLGFGRDCSGLVRIANHVCASKGERLKGWVLKGVARLSVGVFKRFKLEIGEDR